MVQYWVTQNIKYAGTHLYVPRVERCTIRVNCLVQEQHTVPQPGLKLGPLIWSPEHLLLGHCTSHKQSTVKPELQVPTLLYNICWSENVRMISIHVCPTFFVGQMFDKFSNICPTKNDGKTWMLSVLTLSDQQMLYNNVGMCSPSLTVSKIIHHH